jgi:hypothetical protein
MNSFVSTIINSFWSNSSNLSNCQIFQMNRLLHVKQGSHLYIVRTRTVGCPTINVKSDFHGDSARLRNFTLLLNCRKKNQPDWIRFQTSKESSKIIPSFPLFIWKLEKWKKCLPTWSCINVSEKWKKNQYQLRPKIQVFI